MAHYGTNEPSGWTRSSHSFANNNCVEVRHVGDAIQVRDSKNAGSRFLTFTPDEWEAFLAGANAGEFTTQRLSNPPA